MFSKVSKWTIGINHREDCKYLTSHFTLRCPSGIDFFFISAGHNSGLYSFNWPAVWTFMQENVMRMENNKRTLNTNIFV